jgi:glutamine synthetase adenylyltransferase
MRCVVNSFDVKHSPGGMVDVEFAVQFLVLSQGCKHPELLANAGNIALLQRAQAAACFPPLWVKTRPVPTGRCARSSIGRA